MTKEHEIILKGAYVHVKRPNTLVFVGTNQEINGELI